MNRTWPFINPFYDEGETEPILRDLFPNIGEPLISTSLFHAIDIKWRNGSLDRGVPWEGYVDSYTLDIDYFMNHSGGKFCSPLVKSLLAKGGSYVTEDGKLTNTAVSVLAGVIVGKFKKNWERLWDTFDVEYNPIHNYNMTDTRELAKGESETKVGHGSSVDTTEHGRGVETKENVAGLNNTNDKGKLADVSTMQESGETTNTGTSDRKDDAVRASNEVETTTRSGNIGVTTTQQMITAERDVWMWNYFNQIYKDIDSVIALPFYDPCRV